MNKKLVYGLVAVAFVGSLFTAVYAGPVLTTITLAGTIDVVNNQIKNLQDPTDPQDAVTKSYVDNLFTCDGGLTMCTVGVGECQSDGINFCIDGVTQCNAAPGSPSAEICDGLDNDCDGSVNEDCLPNGAACIDPTECSSLFCVDGVCSDTICDRQCEAANITGFEGQCTFIPFGMDPNNECPNSVCNGIGGCGTDFSGTFTIFPSVSYTCASGLVNYDFDQITVDHSSQQMVSFTTSGNPNTMSGIFFDGFTASHTIPGECTETYTITGDFSNRFFFEATFTADFTGTQCSFTDCSFQSTSFTASRPIIIIP